MLKRLLLTAITICLICACAWADCTQTFVPSSNITVAGGNGTKTYNLSGAPIPIEKITFKASKDNGTLTGKPKIGLNTGEYHEYAVGDISAVTKRLGKITNYNYKTLTWNVATSYPYPTASSVTITNQNPKVAGITVNIYVQNIVVTQAKYLQINAWGSTSNNKTKTLETEVEIDASLTEPFTLYYSRANNISISIDDNTAGGGKSGDRNAFSIKDESNNTITSIATTECEWGEKPLLISFNPTRVGTHVVKITLNNNNGNTVVINLTAVCKKKTPTITWKDFQKISTESPLTGAASVSPSNAGIGLTLTYQDPADAEYIAIDGTKLTALKSSGTHDITLIATSAETAKYYSVTSTHTFRTTDLKVQTITWPDNFTRLHVGDDDQTLNAVSSICMPITYTSDNTSVVTIVNGKLHIVGPGKTYIHANAARGLCQCAGGCDGYEADDEFDSADAVLWVRVIDPNAGCDEYSNRNRETGELTDQSGATNVGGGLYIALQAPPATLTFTGRHGAGAHIAGPTVQYSLKEQNEWLDEAWVDIHKYTDYTAFGTAWSCQFSTSNKVFSLEGDTINRDAVYLRIIDGLGVTMTHYFSNALVAQATYLDRNGASSPIVMNNVSTLDNRLTFEISLYYSNLPEPIFYSLENNTPGLSVTFNETQNQTIACGTYGGWGGKSKEDKANGYYSTPLRTAVNFQFDQTQDFPADGTYRDVIVFQSGNVKHRVPIEIHLRKVDQGIEWSGLDVDDPNVEIVDRVSLKAYAINLDNSQCKKDGNGECVLDANDNVVYDIKMASLKPYSEIRMPITYHVDNPDVATISGGVLTFLKEGTVTVTAEQKGDNRYNPTATNITKTITVTKVTPEVDTAPDKAIMYNGYYLERAAFEGGNVRYIGKGRTTSNPKVKSVAGRFNAKETTRFIRFADDGKAIDYDFQPDNTAHFNIDVEGKGKVALEVRRATLRFDGNAGTTDESTIANYLSEDYEGVRERLPLTEGEDNLIVQAKMDLDAHLNVYDANMEAGTDITIAPQGEFTVNNTLTGATKENVKLSSTSEGSGSLRFRSGTPKAHVEVFSKAYYAGKGALAEWQFIGTPVDNVDVQNYFAGSWMYGWNENGWVARRNGYLLPRFTAVAVTQSSKTTGKTYNFYGDVTNEDRDFDLTYTPGAAWEGFNIIANSYTAPIDISKFEPSTDFENLDATIYIFNTGDSATHWTAHQGQYSIDQDEVVKGQYTASTPGSALYSTEQRVIPPMQGFFVKATGNNAKLHLNYERLVMERDHNSRPNKPLRSPAYAPMMSQLPEAEDVDMLKVFITDEAGGDCMQYFANQAFEDGYENGFDARKQYGENGLPSVYAITPDGDMSLNFVPDIEGKYLGVCTGESDNARLTIVRQNPQGELYLQDLLTRNVVALDQDTVNYDFTAEAGAYDETRFRFSRHYSIEGNGGQTTALDNTADGVTIKQHEGKMHITAAGQHIARLFDAAGKLIAETSFNGSHIVEIEQLPHGVYTLRVDNTTKRFVK